MWLFTIQLLFPRIFLPPSRWTGPSIDSTFATDQSRSLSTISTNPSKRFGLLDSIAYFIPTSITNSRVSVTGDLFRCEVRGITALDGLNEKYNSGLHVFLPSNESLSCLDFPGPEYRGSPAHSFLPLWYIATASSRSPILKCLEVVRYRIVNFNHRRFRVSLSQAEDALCHTLPPEFFDIIAEKRR